jgi:hypothetical protein
MSLGLGALCIKNGCPPKSHTLYIKCVSRDREPDFEFLCLIDATLADMPCKHHAGKDMALHDQQPRVTGRGIQVGLKPSHFISNTMVAVLSSNIVKPSTAFPTICKAPTASRYAENPNPCHVNAVQCNRPACIQERNMLKRRPNV